MPVPDIRPVSFFSMPALEPLNALDGKAEPVLVLLYRIFRPQRNTPEAGNGEKRRKHARLQCRSIPAFGEREDTQKHTDPKIGGGRQEHLPGIYRFLQLQG